jgi:hypothetical protein
MPDPEMINKFMLYGMACNGSNIYLFTICLSRYILVNITLFMLFQQLFVNKILKK